MSIFSDDLPIQIEYEYEQYNPEDFYRLCAVMVTNFIVICIIWYIWNTFCALIGICKKDENDTTMYKIVTIKKLKTEKDFERICVQCTSKINKVDIYTTTQNCPHVFHRRCLMQLLKSGHQCPSCRVACLL